jgi:tetratricopeptide (TPR) repeat protein
LLKRARRAYHARAARWLEQMAQSSSRTDENATLIAQHYEQAGDSLSASYWYRRAGKLAASRFANVEAVHAFSRALELTPANAVQDAYKIVLAREQVLDRIGDRQSQRNDLDQLLEFAEAIGDAAIRSEVELRRANFGFATADYSSGISAARQAITLAQAAGSVENEARGYYIWGRSLDFQQAGPESFEKFEKALELARAAGLARLEADILMSLGPHFSDQNKYAESIKYLTAALRIFRQLDDRHGEGKALGNMGVAYWGQGNHAAAQSHFEAALKAVQEVGDRMVEGILTGNLGVLAHEQLDYGASFRHHWQAIQISREVQDRHSEAINLSNLAEAARDLGDFSQARLWYDQALQIARDVGVTQIESGVLISLSLLLEYLGDEQAALELAGQALILAKESKNAIFESAGLYRLAQALLMVNRYDGASDHFQRALDLQVRLGLEGRAIEARAGLARVRLALGDLQSAQGYIEEILPHLQSKNLTGTEEPVRVYLTCFMALHANQDPRALAVLESGYRFLLERQSTIENVDLRSSFLNVVPPNRQLLELWQEFHD